MIGVGTRVSTRPVLELAAVLDLSHEAALALMGDVLDLAAASHADRLLVWRPRRLNPHRVGVLVHEARLYADPDRAIADHDRALGARRVAPQPDTTR